MEEVGALKYHNLCVAIPEQERLWPRCGTEAPALCSRKMEDRRERKAQTRHAAGKIKGCSGSGSESVILKT